MRSNHETQVVPFLLDDSLVQHPKVLGRNAGQTVYHQYRWGLKRHALSLKASRDLLHVKKLSGALALNNP